MLRTPRRLLLWSLVSLLGPGAAGAAPLTYLLSSGAATLTVEQGGVEIGAATGLLTGTSLSFDSASPELLDFELVLAETSIALSPAPGGIENLVLEAAVFTPAAGYTSVSASDLGGGDFFVVAGPVAVDGSWRSEAPGTVTPSTAFSTLNPLLSADLSLSGESLSLLGVTLGVLDLGGEQVTVKADLVFEGVEQGIPEPGAALLMAAGLLAVRSAVRRRAPC